MTRLVRMVETPAYNTAVKTVRETYLVKLRSTNIHRRIGKEPIMFYLFIDPILSSYRGQHFVLTYSCLL